MAADTVKAPTSDQGAAGLGLIGGHGRTSVRLTPHAGRGGKQVRQAVDVGLAKLRHSRRLVAARRGTVDKHLGEPLRVQPAPHVREVRGQPPLIAQINLPVGYVVSVRQRTRAAGSVKLMTRKAVQTRQRRRELIKRRVDASPDGKRSKEGDQRTPLAGRKRKVGGPRRRPPGQAAAGLAGRLDRPGHDPVEIRGGEPRLDGRLLGPEAVAVGAAGRRKELAAPLNPVRIRIELRRRSRGYRRRLGVKVDQVGRDRPCLDLGEVL